MHQKIICFFLLCIIISGSIIRCKQEKSSLVPLSDEPQPQPQATVEKVNEEINIMKYAEILYSETEHSFCIEHEKCVCKITASGKGTMIKQDQSEGEFSLFIKSGDYIDSIQYMVFENDLILIYETASEESDGGYILRLKGKTEKLSWHQKIPGFNLSAGPLEDHFIYVTAIGFVSKLDINTGQFIWKLEGLFRKDGSFASFKPPVIDGDTIILSEEDVMKRQLKVLYLNKLTGALIEGDY